MGIFGKGQMIKSIPCVPNAAFTLPGEYFSDPVRARGFTEQSRQMQTETEDCHPCDNYTSVSVCVIHPLSLINKSLCMGFERKVTITFCDLDIFLRTPPLACKAGKS